MKEAPFGKHAMRQKKNTLDWDCIDWGKPHCSMYVYKLLLLLLYVCMYEYYTPCMFVYYFLSHPLWGGFNLFEMQEVFLYPQIWWQ